MLLANCKPVFEDLLGPHRRAASVAPNIIMHTREYLLLQKVLLQVFAFELIVYRIEK